MTSFQRSPTLEETNVLNSNLRFQSLEIDGTLTVIQDFNESNFQGLLSSVVYKVKVVAKTVFVIKTSSYRMIQ